MRIGLFGVGTRGDVAPLIVLAKRLSERKHGNVITLFVSYKHRKLAEKHQVEISYLDNDYLLSRRITRNRAIKKKKKKKKYGDQHSAPLEPRARTPTPPPQEPPRAIHDLIQACRQVDLIVYTELLTEEMLTISEYLRKPAVALLFSPTASFPTGTFPIGLLNSLNNLVIALTRVTDKRLKKINSWREELALQPYRSLLGFIGSSWINPPTALACWSQEVLPRSLDWGASIHQCGYLTLGSDRYHHTSIDLKRFLSEADGKIIFITLGSSKLKDPRLFWKTILETLRELQGHRIYAVLQPMLENPYMSDLSRSELRRVGRFIEDQLMGELGSYVYYLRDEFPHSWIFPQVEAVLHHCGSGTTASVLKAGVIHIPLPIEKDQRMWAKRLVSLGVGTSPLKEKLPKVEKLAKKLVKATKQKRLLHNAKALATRINDSGEGVDLACEYLKDLVARYEFMDHSEAAEADLTNVLFVLPGFTFILMILFWAVVVFCLVLDTI